MLITQSLSAFLLAGKGTMPAKLRDMEKRSIKVTNLQRIQKLLLGETTLDAMNALPPLTRRAFDGDGYQMARVTKAPSEADQHLSQCVEKRPIDNREGNR